ncbi:o-succinylbenzoate synthase [Mariniphaga anaerophila]|uniref:O-succinylbenzoate synthase n=1 Tax=Mariniphaga anaerophila TaxID=1484053 RepID=A0A1M5CTL0_9BACT|nr:o-succinylbenzoate synthase [Mariniphaga anaerophila]SHF58075.1 o-succinylbenzoate synthase [Mariniphaga anaerophila]
MKAYFKKYELQFKRPARTSRGEYKARKVWYLFLTDNNQTGVGECAPLPDLSYETPEQVEQLLTEVCADPVRFIQNPGLTTNVSSVRFALETAWLDLQNGGKQLLFPSEFTDGKAGIPINGLIWMGSTDFILQQLHEKLEAGFRCIKLKIGSNDFDREVEILNSIRERFDEDQIVLRVDANGAFQLHEAQEKLARLAALKIHSIEQPIAAGQWSKMGEICRKSPVPVALDEELIGVCAASEKEKLLDTIHPQFLVLKPSLHGGFFGCVEWIELAEKRNIRWWITSYLESNIGLNAIAQWTFHKNAQGYQGLGTGSLFTNNISSPLEIEGEELWMVLGKKFEFPENFFAK